MDYARDPLGLACGLASEAADVLSGSAALLRQALALAEEGSAESLATTRSLAGLSQRLRECGDSAAAQPVTPGELAAVAAEARQLMRQSAAAVLRVRAVIGCETVAERFGWRRTPPGTTMKDLHARLEQLGARAAEAAAAFPAARSDLQLIADNIANMRVIVRNHRSVVNDAIAALENMQLQAGFFVQLLAGDSAGGSALDEGGDAAKQAGKKAI